MKLRRQTAPPRENPRDTLVRFAKAIDNQFDENTAPPKQRADLAALNEVMQKLMDAQSHQLSCVVINTRVGIALGLCERYMLLYGITPPDPSA